MTAICYSQLSGFRSPWGGGLVGGVDKRLADLLGLLLPLLPHTELFPPPSPPLSIPPFSLCTVCPSLRLLFPHFTLFFPPLHPLYSRTFSLWGKATREQRCESSDRRKSQTEMSWILFPSPWTGCDGSLKSLSANRSPTASSQSHNLGPSQHTDMILHILQSVWHWLSLPPITNERLPSCFLQYQIKPVIATSF